MRKFIIVIVLLLISSLIYGQNDYFGSIIIPKNEYLIKLANTDSYWNIPNNNKIQVHQHTGSKFIFIPAGKGYYYIKSQKNGHYLHVTNKNMNNGSDLQMRAPQRNDAEKFMVVKVQGNNIKIISVNELTIECNQNTETIKLSIDNGKSTQQFKILDATSKEVLK